MADGGEGTLDALVSALGGDRHRERVTGPLGYPVDAEFGIAPLPGGQETLGIVEMALASGLELIPESRRDPKLTTTRGTGELILAACEQGVSALIVCIGGSATNDGGAGMAQAIGARLLDADGSDIRSGGEALLSLSRIDLSGVDERLSEVSVSVACDVDNPLVGPTGAAATYGPQKGATTEDVILLDRALGHFAAVLQQDLGIDLRETPGAGAAGGLGAGLIAFLGAKLRPGIDVVMDAAGFADRLAAADAVLTGEGQFDSQSLHGKTTMGVVEAAEQAGVPVAVLCGAAEVTPESLRIKSLAARFGLERALGEARLALEELASEVAASWA